MRIGGEGKRKNEWRTVDFSKYFAYHRKVEKIGRVITNTALQN